MSNQAKTGKYFDKNPLTHSAAHYLVGIKELHKAHGYARMVDIAKRLGIAPSSCSITLKNLRSKGFIQEDENKFISLTTQGEYHVAVIEKNDELLVSFLKEVLGVNAEQAEIDACKMDHLLSAETSIKLNNFLSLLKTKSKAVKEFIKMLNNEDLSCEHIPEKCRTCKVSCWLEV